jgi:hypothetical protein
MKPTSLNSVGIARRLFVYLQAGLLSRRRVAAKAWVERTSHYGIAASIQRGVADAKLGEVYTINLYGDLFKWVCMLHGGLSVYP